MKLVWKLLRQHISVPQFVGFFIANLVGMLIILLGIQFYSDTRSVFSGKDALVSSDYIIVNKKVGAMTTILGKSNTFSRSEIEDIGNQPFVDRVGYFTPATFNISASISIKGMSRMSTDMFFEAVPDEFVDVQTEKWNYTEGDRRIPIILPRDYLDLYNFGYAQSRSLPKLSEGILGALAFQISIRGNGGTVDQYEGRIAGFSSRLNTILVPQKFIEWANSRYAGTKLSEPTRLILEVNNPTDQRIATYLKENNYITDNNKLTASKTNYVLRIIVGIVMGVGGIICLLSFYILMLSIYLLVEKNSTKLENLLLLGYSPAKVSFPYQTITVALNAAVLLLAFALLLVVRSIYMSGFTEMFPDMQPATLIPTVVIGILLFLLISIVNILVIRRAVVRR